MLPLYFDFEVRRVGPRRGAAHGIALAGAPDYGDVGTLPGY